MTSPLHSAQAVAAATSGRSWPAVLKLALALYLPVTLVLIGMGYFLLKTDTDARMQKLKAQELSEVRMAEQLLIDDFANAISDLRFLAQNSSLKRYLNDGTSAEKRRVTDQFLSMAQAKQRYDQIRFLDHNGMEKIRVNLIHKQAVTTPEKDLQNKSERYFFRDTFSLAAAEIYISPLDLNIEQGKIELPYKPTLRFGTPLLNDAGNRRGILLLNYYGQELLDDFKKVMGEQRHTMLLNANGYWLSSPDPAQEWGFIFGRDDTFGKYHPDAWRKISTEQHGSMFTTDGLYTFATVQPLLAARQTAAHGQNSVTLPSSAYNLKIVSLVPAGDLPSISPSQYPRSYALFGLGLSLLALLALYQAENILSRRKLRAGIFENEAHLKEITSTLGEGIYVVDQQELTTFINPEAERLLGWTQAEMIGKNAHDMIHYRSLDGSPIHATDCEIYRVMQTGQAYRSSTQVFWRKDGSHLYVDVSTTPIIRDGKVTGAVVAFNDIGIQKQNEISLLNNTLLLKQAQRLAQVGSWELDLTTQSLIWSDEIYQIFEIPPDAFGASYEAFLNAIHPQDRELVNRTYNESVKNHLPYSTEHRLLLADGRIKHVIERGETIYDANDRPLRSIGTVQDITERKIAQDALHTSKETARALLNATTESAILMDTAGVVLAINLVAARRLNKRPDEIIGRNVYELLPADVAASRKKLVDEVVRSGQPCHAFDKRNGMHFDQTMYPILDAKGKVYQIAIYAADITERIKLQAEETLLHHIDQQVLRSKSLPLLLKFICNEIVQLFGYHFAWLGKKEADGEFSVSAQSGIATDYMQELIRIGVRWDDTPQGQGPAGSCVRSGQMQVFKIVDSSFKPWHDAAVRAGLKSAIGIPLVVRGQVYGSLTLYSRLAHDFDDDSTLKRLSSLANRICVALETAMDQEHLRLLSTALASAGNGVFISDAQGRIQWVNNAFTRLTGYSSTESIGRTPSLLKSGKQDAAYYKTLWQTIQQGKTWNSETVERHKNGSLFTVQQNITPIKDEHGVISHFVSILDDITSQKKIAERIQYMAHFDALTSLPNRALFRDRLRQTLAQAKRDGKTCALMFLDLDRFKAVNDTMGHHVGDLLLQAVAERLTACVRETDTVSRLAGDEFTVILPNMHGREDAALIAEKITAALAAPFYLELQEVNIGSSTGIAYYPADATSDEALIKCADQAMYLAKEEGRGTYRFFKAPD